MVTHFLLIYRHEKRLFKAGFPRGIKEQMPELDLSKGRKTAPKHNATFNDTV